jgi:hypothetical protein
MKRLSKSLLPDIRRMISAGIELREVSNIIGVDHDRMISYLKKYKKYLLQNKNMKRE